MQEYQTPRALQDCVASPPPAVTTSQFGCYGKAIPFINIHLTASEDRSSSTEPPPPVCQLSSPSPMTRPLEFCIPTAVWVIAELLSRGAASPGWTTDQQLIQVINYVGVCGVVELQCAEDGAND
uniref:Uncharacterized protein n=1 Tax=Sus scrofa TaxID=9823 RepID=A0A4X1SEJ0_PIG